MAVKKKMARNMNGGYKSPKGKAASQPKPKPKKQPKFKGKTRMV